MFQIALDYLKTLYSGTGYIKKTKSKQTTHNIGDIHPTKTTSSNYVWK